MPCDTAGLGSSPFDRLYWGNRSYFLLLRVLRCFSSPRSPHALGVMAGSLPPGCPIRISVGQWVFAPRHGFSQLVTSFIASESLGIPHAPLLRSVLSLLAILAILASLAIIFYGFRLFASCACLSVSQAHCSRRSFALLFCFLVSLASRFSVFIPAAFFITPPKRRKIARFHHVIVLFLSGE